MKIGSVGDSTSGAINGHFGSCKRTLISYIHMYVCILLYTLHSLRLLPAVRMNINIVVVGISLLPVYSQDEWQVCTDQNSGYTYYWNTVTNNVSWTLPQGVTPTNLQDKDTSNIDMSVSEENTGEVVYGPTILEEAESGVPSPSPCTAEIQEEADLQENVDPEEADKTGTTLKLDMQNGNGNEDSEANQDGVSLVGYVPSESDESDIDNMLDSALEAILEEGPRNGDTLPASQKRITEAGPDSPLAKKTRIADNLEDEESVTRDDSNKDDVDGMEVGVTGDKEGVANLKPNNGSNRPQLQIVLWRRTCIIPILLRYSLIEVCIDSTHYIHMYTVFEMVRLLVF